jgi:hypothetical protein
MMVYDIENIKIGDEVIFNSTNSQSNHDEYWTVRGKRDNQIMIELIKFGFEEYWTIDIKEVVAHIPLNR